MSDNKANTEESALYKEYLKAVKREKEAFKKMSPDEQKQYLKELDAFQERMDSMNYY